MTKRKSSRDRERERKGLGTVWERSDGRWNAAISVPVSDSISDRVGKQRKSTTKKTEEEAEAWLETVRRKVAAAGGVLTVGGKSGTLTEHLEVWLRDSVAPRVAPRTLDKRVWAVSNHIAPALGRLKLTDVTPRRVQSLYADLSRDGYSLATRREIHATLRQAMAQAVRWGLIERNPASPELVDAPRRGPGDFRSDTDEEVRALSDEQARRLFEYARETGSRWENYYVFAVRVGMRPGEALALSWGEVDLTKDPATARVVRTLDTKSHARFGPPKSAASKRTIPLHHEAKAALLAQREMLAAENLPTGKKDLVFPSRSGSPMNAGNLLRRYMRNDLDGAGLPRITLHELRHTFASIMLHEWMIPAEIVRDMMGHESIRMTSDLYGHLMPTATSDAVRRLNEMYRHHDDLSTRRPSA